MKDFKLVANFFGVTKAELASLDEKKMEELFLKKLETINTTEGCVALALIAPINSELYEATTKKMYELVSEMRKVVKRDELEQILCINKTYELFKIT